MLGIITSFTDVTEHAIKKLITNPKKAIQYGDDEIEQFKKDIDIDVRPGEIDIKSTRATHKELKKYRKSVEEVANRYTKLRDKISFGGNYIRAILRRPKVYSTEIDGAAYDVINRNVRNINRGMDWIEKSLMDLFNLIDHDINTIRWVDKVYGKHKIYEDVQETDSEPVLDMEDPTMDDDNLNWVESFLMEEGENDPPEMQPEQKESMPKKTDKAESDKNGVRRKKLYIAFIEWAKTFNAKNTFGSIFDKDAFNISYPFVPDEMRYFYRLANPILCVLSGNLTFFQLSELRKLNAKNSRMDTMLIFAATQNDLRVFNKQDKKVYRGTEENGAIKLHEVLGNTFDTYLQNMINQGDILNAPIEEKNSETAE